MYPLFNFSFVGFNLIENYIVFILLSSFFKKQNALLVLLGGSDVSGIDTETEQINATPQASVLPSTDNQDLLDLLGTTAITCRFSVMRPTFQLM